jgi:choline dehydrogenase-like flavoprotein
MWIDPANFRAGHVERARVCIIGSGPAGMSLALGLERAGIGVLLIEAGDDGFDPASQDLYDGEVVGDDYFDLTQARLRQLGGSSGHWGGICRPLTRVDFNTAPPSGATGWPIGFDDLAPYTQAAAEIVEIPGTFEDVEIAPSLYRLAFERSLPVHFGNKYYDHITSAPNLRVALKSALVDLETEDGRIVSASIFSDPDRRWRVEADYFVLCAGGIENSRLLGWINARHDRALVANHDLIGRYWMEHLFTVPCHGLIFDDDLSRRAEAERTFIGLTSLLAETGHTGINFEIEPMPDTESRGMLDRMLCVAPRLGNRLMRTARGRDQICGLRLLAHSEQWPHADNRVALGNESDRLGIPKTRLHWRRFQDDRAIVTEAAQSVAEIFAEADLGRMTMMHWTFQEDRSMSLPGWRTGAWHHMGGTRMAHSPEDGIVDTNLKVHDLDNLYIGGSSVFPMGGDANPTFTILQLSLRLADHLSDRIES